MADPRLELAGESAGGAGGRGLVPSPLPPDDPEAWYAPDVQAQYEVHPGVVVTDRATYRGILSGVLLTYDIPFIFVNEIGIEQTLVGGAMQALLDLTDEEARKSSLYDLASNTLVTLDAFGIDTDALSTAAAKTPDQTLERLLETLEDDDHDVTADGIRELVTALDPGEDGPGEVCLVKRVPDPLGFLG